MKIDIATLSSPRFVGIFLFLFLFLSSFLERIRTGIDLERIFVDVKLSAPALAGDSSINLFDYVRGGKVDELREISLR